jgi:hypothetical protein
MCDNSFYSFQVHDIRMASKRRLLEEDIAQTVFETLEPAVDYLKM